MPPLANNTSLNTWNAQTAHECIYYDYVLRYQPLNSRLYAISIGCGGENLIKLSTRDSTWHRQENNWIYCFQITDLPVMPHLHLWIGSVLVQITPILRQAIIYTNAGLFLIELLGTNCSEILVKTQNVLFPKLHSTISSVK